MWKMKKIGQIISNYWPLLLAIAIKLLMQFVLVNPIYELHRDEFLYLNQADHLAWGFISVPPLTALFSKIIYLLGGNLFLIRLLPALFGIFTLVIGWFILEDLGGKAYAKLLTMGALLFSPLVRLNILFQPNSFDILVWTTIFWFLICYIQTGKPKWLYLLAIAVTLGFYNKYNLIFLLIGLAGGILLTRQRQLFLTVSFWKAVSLAFILLLPNLLWQYNHQFPVLEHMRVLKSSQLDNNSASGFLLGQLMFFFGSIPLTITALIGFIRVQEFKPYRLIGIGFVISLAIFTLLKAKDYYAIGLYPVLFVFGSIYLEKLLAGNGKYWILPSLFLINLGIFILTARWIYPVYPPEKIRDHAAEFESLGMLRWEDGKNHNLPQDFADMLGWKEMSQKALRAYQHIPTDELNQTIVFCDNYGQAGALNYYNRGLMSEAYSFNTDYIFWIPRMNRISNILLVGEKPDQEVLDLFSEWKQIDSIENEQAREHNSGIYLLTGAKPEFTTFFYREAEEQIDRFDIF